MRDDWTSNANYTLIDAGPHGFLTGGHAHADALSFVLSVAGQPVFIDPGTFVYTVNDGERDHFRSTAAHNTVTVDGASSSQPGAEPFRWDHSARSTVSRWIASARFDFIEGAHDGFMRLESPVRHERSVLYVKSEYWVILDRLVSDGPHDLGVHFHCAPGVTALLQSNQSVVFRVGIAPRTFDVALETFSSAPGAFSLTSDWVSPQYGRKVEATACTFRARANGTTDIASFVMPVGRSLPRVSSSMPGIYEVSINGMRDSICIGAFADGIETDAAWAWVRRDATTGMLAAYFLIDGSKLVVDGVEIVNVGQRVCCLESPVDSDRARPPSAV
jgi:hypothetical protein